MRQMMFVLLLVAGCETPEAGERCNPLQFSNNGVQGDCDTGLACVYPSAPNCGVAFCCVVDAKGKLVDTHANCRPDPSLTATCMLDLGTD
jgi:hypothetical protein